MKSVRTVCAVTAESMPQDQDKHGMLRIRARVSIYSPDGDVLEKSVLARTEYCELEQARTTMQLWRAANAHMSLRGTLTFEL